MKLQEIRDMETAGVVAALKDADKELMDLRLGNAIGAVDNPCVIREKKRDIARLKTVLRERELEIR